MNFIKYFKEKVATVFPDASFKIYYPGKSSFVQIEDAFYDNFKTLDNVVVITPEFHLIKIYIPECKLNLKQARFLIGNGYVEIISNFGLYNVLFLADEDGKLKRLNFNILAFELTGQVIYGNLIVLPKSFFT